MMIRFLAILATLTLPSGVLVLGETDAIEQHRMAVAFILEHVQCSNADEVARIAFSEYDMDMLDDDAYRTKPSIGTCDLGDGTTCYAISLPGGASSWGVRPNYNFVMVGDRLELVFDGRGASSVLLGEGEKYNGRYLIERMGRTYVGGSEEDEVALFREIYFWSGTDYLHAYTEYFFDLPDALGQDRSSMEWVPEARLEFLSARVTWSHRVDSGDTLTKISREYTTDVDEIVSQNGIEDPDVIQEGQVLSYDSQRTASGKHASALDTDAEGGAG